MKVYVVVKHWKCIDGTHEKENMRVFGNEEDAIKFASEQKPKTYPNFFNVETTVGHTVQELAYGARTVNVRAGE